MYDYVFALADALMCCAQWGACQFFGAGCVAPANALPRCAQQLLHAAVARGAVRIWLVQGSSLNVFYWAKLLMTKSLIRHPWKDSSTLLIHKYLRFFSSDNLENQINMIYYLIVNAVK